jgi:uncharacterized protein YycO
MLPEKKSIVLKFQRQNTAPHKGILLIKPTDLQSGDILFSTDSSQRSHVLRLFGNTSVSHAFLYLGDGEVVEAVGRGVHIMLLVESGDENPELAVYRHLHLNNLQAEKIREFAEAEAAGKYHYVGIIK